jgi:carboxypeptidase C (cathepsin A)
MVKKMNRGILILLLFALAFIPLSPAAFGAPDKEAPAAAPADEPADRPGALDAAYSAITRHTLKAGKETLEYTATAASITVMDREEEPAGRIFFIAYRLENKTGGDRPVTFVFNGGPGAASAYLHMGALGPRRVVFNEDGTVPAMPVQIADNPHTWLAFTDLVFVDPVGTGYSRTAEAGGAENGAGNDAPAAPGSPASPSKSQAWGVEEDTDSLARFIRAYLTREDRWRSPVYLAGESYGGFRVARLSRLLQSDFGIAPSGLVLISPALDFSMIWGDEFSLWTGTAQLPSYAAVAAVHGKGGPDGFSEQDLRGSLAGVEALALSDYISSLAGGEFTAPWLEKMSRLTGLDADTLSRFSGRVPINRFVKALLSGQRRIVSLYDGSITMADPDPAGQMLYSTPYLDRINAPFTAALNSYVRSELAFKTDLPYLLLNTDVNRAWNWQSGINGRQGFVEAVADLKNAMTINPHMRALVVHGAYDLVTPYFSSELAIRQMGLHPDIRDHIKIEVYPGGHMPYLRLESLEAMSGDAAAFYQP